MSDFNFRYCASFLVEAATALKIGTGETGLNIDELAATDANGLPVIPGTAICGVLRHTFEAKMAKEFFGYQAGKNGKGSRLIFSGARFVGKKGKVIDGLCPVDYSDLFYSKFKKMAIRDHCRINHRAVADIDQHGKFDSQVVFKGCRFVFDVELIGNEMDDCFWKTLLSTLNSELFRIGGGTRKGFGELKVVSMEEQTYSLEVEEELQAYLDKSSKLTIPIGENVPELEPENFFLYELKLLPDDFFIFSSGYGDMDVDSIGKKESFIEWNNGKPSFSSEKIIVPATSVKGVISHRTAFHYNRLAGNYANRVDTPEDYINEKNLAVKALFGFAKDSDRGEDHGQRGKVLFSDCFMENTEEKIFNHVAVDRFTGGALDGALFDEKVVHGKNEITLKIVVENEAFNGDPKIKEAFELALKDITTGMLPLGGSTMRGHGCFNGKLIKNGEEI